MSKAIIALFSAIILAVGALWYRARGDIARLEAKCEAQAVELAAARADVERTKLKANAVRAQDPMQSARPMPAAKVEPADSAPGMSDAEQAAVLIAALSAMPEQDASKKLAEAREELDELRRRLERAENSAKRDRAGRSESLSKLAEVLRENQGLRRRCDELERSCSTLATRLQRLQNR